MRDDRMRHELKFHLPVSNQSTIRALIRDHVRHDPYAARMPDGVYTVRSIYFDNEDLDFYHEKLDSVKTRRKLRVRTYNSPETCDIAFVEIKRKFGRVGCKDRLLLPLGKVEAALGDDDVERVLGENSRLRERTVLGKIRYLMQIKHLKPVVLITYDREAFIGRRDPQSRVTFDMNIRSLINPTLDDIFEEQKLLQFEDQHFVLELKYNGRMPHWMATLIRRLGLSARSYSKYCTGLEYGVFEGDGLYGPFRNLAREG